jgi:hypothetical protein
LQLNRIVSFSNWNFAEIPDRSDRLESVPQLGKLQSRDARVPQSPLDNGRLVPQLRLGPALSACVKRFFGLKSRAFSAYQDSFQTPGPGEQREAGKPRHLTSQP